MIINKDDAQEIFRGKVLEAMDQAAREIFLLTPKESKIAGATDGDLPRIFPILDAQLEGIAHRFHHVILEEQDYNQYLLMH